MKRRAALLLTACVTLLVGLVPDAGAARAWAPAATASVHPGVETSTSSPNEDGGGQCTANFVFEDAAGVVYLGQSAHCAGKGLPTDTDGCDSASLPLGTQVRIEGASQPGTLVYSSWLTMQRRRETDPEACAYNDFALVRIHPADVAKVNPSVPRWGGPVALGDGTDEGEAVYTYGNSGLRFGIGFLKPKRGTSYGMSPGGWEHTVETFTPGIPGDSGSAFLDSRGRAIGTLSTLGLSGLNGVGDLAHELGYAAAHGGFRGLRLVLGTEPFDPR